MILALEYRFIYLQDFKVFFIVKLYKTVSQVDQVTVVTLQICGFILAVLPNHLILDLFFLVQPPNCGCIWLLVVWLQSLKKAGTFCEAHVGMSL